MYAYNPLLVIFTLVSPYSTLYCHIYLHMTQTKSQFSHNYLYLSVVYPYVLFKHPHNSHIYPVLAIIPIILNIPNYLTMLKSYFSYICLYAWIEYPYIVCMYPLLVIFTLFEPYSTLYYHIYSHITQTKS